jgi:hypothetical protein
MWIFKSSPKTNLGDFFSFLKKFPKNGKQITKFFETIKLNKKLMLGIWLKHSKLRLLFKGLFKWFFLWIFWYYIMKCLLKCYPMNFKGNAYASKWYCFSCLHMIGIKEYKIWFLLIYQSIWSHELDFKNILY